MFYDIRVALTEISARNSNMLAPFVRHDIRVCTEGRNGFETDFLVWLAALNLREIRESLMARRLDWQLHTATDRLVPARGGAWDKPFRS